MLMIEDRENRMIVEMIRSNLNRIVNFDFLKLEATSFLEVDMGFAWALFGLILIDFSPTKIPLGQP